MTCISPGGIANDVPVAEGEIGAKDKHGNTRIPISDFAILIRAVMATSTAAFFTEIQMPATLDLADGEVKRPGSTPTARTQILSINLQSDDAMRQVPQR